MSNAIVLGSLFLAVLIVLGGLALGYKSAGGTPPGLTAQGRLAPCPSAANCVSSDAPVESTAHVAPLPALSSERLKAAMTALGADLAAQGEGYLAFTATTALMRFVDDVEFRLTPEATHVRSASRVGYSDLGANRKRVDTIRAALGQTRRGQQPTR